MSQCEGNTVNGCPSKVKPAAGGDGQAEGKKSLVYDTKPVVESRDSKVRSVMYRENGSCIDAVNPTVHLVGRQL